jgi:hypothetical protein
MGDRFRDYIKECIAEAPNAFRRGMVIVTVLANLAIAGALLLGWHLNALTSTQLMRAGAAIAVLELLLIVPFRLWKSNKAEIERLNAQIAQKIKILDVLEHRDAFNGMRTFELEIQNDSEVELTNCLAKVTAISLFKLNPDGAQDYSAPYIRHLPLALRTSRNVDRDGGGPFHLRAREIKKIPIFSRQDGFGKDVQINFEKGAPEFLAHITLVSICDLEVTVYGAPNPPKENIHIAVDGAIVKVTHTSLNSNLHLESGARHPSRLPQLN